MQGEAKSVTPVCHLCVGLKGHLQSTHHPNCAVTEAPNCSWGWRHGTGGGSCAWQRARTSTGPVAHGKVIKT